MANEYPPVHYHEYLGLDRILNAQSPKSHEYGNPAHDEMLFIIVHQVYELWFKQLLHEANSVLRIFAAERVQEKEMGLVVHRLDRMSEILKLLIDQIRILETMTPLDFLEFRDMLFPASGFQSFQFRQFEVRLGLKRDNRLQFNSKPYTSALTPDQARAIDLLEKQPNLFDCLDRWLERTPFLNVAGFDFWQSYKKSVMAMFVRDKNYVTQHPSLGEEDKRRNLEIMTKSEEAFQSLFDEQTFEKARTQGQWRLSFKSVHAALFIQIYRDQPVLQLPFRLLTALIDLDELMTNWRYRHALMAKRMLGTKIGTGGSSGYDYLKASTELHRLFSDLNQLTTFFISRSKLPELPEDVERELGFYYSTKGS